MLRNPKVCGRCGEQYIPTGNCQKFCVQCKDVEDKNRHAARHRRTYKRRGYNQEGENNNAYKNGIGSYKAMALKHYGRKCMLCDSTKFICVHHKDGNRKNNDLSNLEVICRKCHAKIHDLHKNFTLKRYSQRTARVVNKC